MGRISFVVSAFVALATIQAMAYTPTVTPRGIPVKWAGENKINLAGNPANRSQISDADFSAAVIRGLQRWKAASDNTVKFDYYQGRDNAVYEPNSNYNGLSSIYFSSNGGGSIPSNVLGLTQVWYNTDTGQILEADIGLNDVNFKFSTNPKDSTGYGGSMGGGYAAFIENVITHEIGHAFGLSHSGGLQTTMLFMEAPEQAFLGCDEQTGISALYRGGTGANRGMLSGSVVQDSNGAPIFGAHVEAISQRRGTVMGSGITDVNGNFLIGGLEPGAYIIMAEPYYAGASTLPSYYASMNSKVCSGAQFSRTLLVQNDGITPNTQTVNPGAISNVPTVRAKCGAGSGFQVQTGTNALVTAPTLFTGSSGGFSTTDKLSGTSVYYKISNVSGHLEVRIAAYSLYSPTETSIQLLDQNSNPVTATIANDSYVGTSSYVNHDAALVADGLPLGDYWIKISPSSLSFSNYPAGSLNLDSTSFMVITGSVNESGPTSNIPYNARCKMDENFPAYHSPSGPPPRSAVQSGGEDEDTGFCGTIQSRKDGSGGSHGGPSAGAIIGWLLPWLFMGLSVRVIRLRVLLRRPVTANL